MKTEQRPLIAAIVAAAVNGKPYTTTYDYQRGEHAPTAVEILGKQVIAFDAERKTHLLGRLPIIHDFERDQRLRVEVRDNRATGHDFGSDGSFTVKVDGALVSFYDDETGAHYNFAVA